MTLKADFFLLSKSHNLLHFCRLWSYFKKIKLKSLLIFFTVQNYHTASNGPTNIINLCTSMQMVATSGIVATHMMRSLCRCSIRWNGWETGKYHFLVINFSFNQQQHKQQKIWEARSQSTMTTTTTTTKAVCEKKSIKNVESNAAARDSLWNLLFADIGGFSGFGKKSISWA